MKPLEDIVRRNRAGEPVALTSVCSAHPDVLSASLQLAKDEGKALLIEATSNQVNQFGGYTGMRPSDFVGFVHRLCDAQSIDRAQILFGGDHLGPQAWRQDDAGIAMAKAEAMMREYIAAGFTKIHLDCSEGCRGEPAQVGDALAAERAARLAQACEAAATDRADISYIIGTEVPPPGGARADEEPRHLVATTPDRAAATLERHAAAFRERGMDEAFERVAGLVVQPGVEFGPDHIDAFDTTTPDTLSTVLEPYANLAFEAHSTDYQRNDVFADLARRHFAILKVGPALTFAYRRAVYALDALLQWRRPAMARRSVPDIMEDAMLRKPNHWQAHYSGPEEMVRLLRHFGYADRIRYYWTQPEASAAVAVLEDEINALKAPRAILHQYLCIKALERADRLRSCGFSPAKALIFGEIQLALMPYFIVAPQTRSVGRA